MYDLVAGDRNVKSSYYLSKKNTLELFPMLKSDNLCGGIVYYDGEFDNVRVRDGENIPKIIRLLLPCFCHYEASAIK